MKPNELARELANNCDDVPILENLLNFFRELTDKDKETVVVQLVGNLSKCREEKGYGPKASGGK